MKSTWLLLCMLILPLLGKAQSRLRASAAVWPALEFNYGVGTDGLLFIRNAYRINTDERLNDLRPTGILRNVERVEVTLGYEHEITDHWRGGGLIRYAAEDFPKILFPSIFLRHYGAIGSLFFNKQAMLEYVAQEQRRPYGRSRLTFEIGKRIPVNNTFITPAIEYEAFKSFDFEQQNVQRNSRFIDRTRLRLGITYEITDQWRIQSYAMRQTDYYYLLVGPKYDEYGQLLERGYSTKRNRILPVLGIEVKYSLNTTPNPASISY